MAAHWRSFRKSSGSFRCCSPSTVPEHLSLIECSEGYTEFDDEFVRQIIQKITVEDADTIRIQFRDSDVVLEQGLQ